MRAVRHILTVLVFFVFAGFIQAQETEEGIKEKANKLFDKEQYVEATPLFLRLISLNPKDVSYNYRYGTCLLFNSDDQKKDAMRYLTFATKSSSVDPMAFYFRGKAFHLNYQFKQAKQMYQAYKKKRPSKDKRIDIDREIEMCDNGKRLLSTFTDIVVSEKKEIDETKFFRLYHDMESIGGKILVTERFQSKMDKKMGHIPIVHFPKNATAVYYSSYGEKGENGLDIYIRKKLPDGTWGEPFKLPGEVNTKYDDNFPYLHPSGRYLYFSSKGHNSMGGYDVFVARYNPAINGFTGTENVDFAICSPDDDLFYVVDSAYQNAYFASARQSEAGKLHVYRVRVARIPIQEVIIMGDFLSEINPENKDMFVTVIAGATGKEIGRIKSNVKGQYSYAFPQGGKYTYQIKVAGIDQVTEIDFDLPFMDEFRPLKQRIIHRMTPEGEVVMIENLFDELIDGGSELIGPILRKKAELNINVNDFDPAFLAAIQLEQMRDGIIEELGFTGMTPREVQNQLAELSKAEQGQQGVIKKMSDGIDQNIIGASMDLKELVAIQQDLINNANLASGPAEKYEYLTDAKRIGEEITALTDQIGSLIDLKGIIQTKFGDEPQNGGVTGLTLEFNELLEAGDEEAAWNLLALNQSKIFKVRNVSPEELIRDMIDESIELRTARTRLDNRNSDNTALISMLEADIILLKGQLPGAKRKREQQLKDEIADKEQELQIYLNETRLNRGDMIALDRKSSVLDENVGILQESVNGNLLASVGSAELEAAIKDAKAISSGNPEMQILNDIAALENQYPEIGNSEPIIKPTTQSALIIIETEHADAIELINSDPRKTEIEKIESLIVNNQRTTEQVVNKIEELQNQLDKDPENFDILQEQLELVEYKNELEEETNNYTVQVAQLNNENPPLAISREGVINKVDPTYQTGIDEIEGNNDLTPKEKLDQLQAKDSGFLTNTQGAIVEVNRELTNNPNDAELIERKKILEEIASTTSNTIAERGQEINALGNVSSIVNIEEIKSDVLTNASGTYEEDKTEIEQSGGSKFDISIGIWDLEQEQLDRLKGEQGTIASEAAGNPDDQIAQTKLIAVNQLVVEQTQRVIVQRTKAIQDAVGTNRYTDVIKGADKKYLIEIGDLLQEDPRDYEAIAAREVELQVEIQATMDKRRRSLDRKYSIDVDLDWFILENELNESKIRETAARNVSTIATTQNEKDDFIEKIRTNLLSDQAEEVNKTYTTKEELEVQDQVLDTYQNELITEIAILEADQAENPSTETTSKIKWLNEELNDVRVKRGTISISLDEFQTTVIEVAGTSRQSDPELNKLEGNRAEILNQLNNPDLSNTEKRELNESLEEVETAQVVRQNEIHQDNIAAGQSEQEKLTNQLLAGNDGQPRESIVVAQVLDASAVETRAINELIDDAGDANSEEERRYLLTQAQIRQDALVSAMEDVVQNRQIKNIEENDGITLATKQDLEDRRRRYTIQIGDYDTQIFQVEEEMKDAKRRDVPELEVKLDRLVIQRAMVAGQLEDTNDQLDNYPVMGTLPVIATTGLDQTLSFNEERTIAASENYAAYQMEGVKALELENELRTLEIDIDLERADLVALIRKRNPDLTPTEVTAEIQLKTERIKQMEADRDRINEELIVQSAKANQLLPANRVEAMKIQNLLARGVQPIKLATAALSIIQMPSNGLAINNNPTTASIYSEENPIPVGVESPSGLIYRVQIGAFARPIPQDLFKEFNPVSGEKIGTTGITRYMAGFFNSSVTVVDARQKIRGLGYRDAFIVAYCDGERISFGEARRREAAGTCIPKGTNELMVEVAENTATHLGIPLTNEVKEVPEYTYNQAPGAVPADPIELKKGLFFTVQIGVYNRPVTDKKLKDLPEILTIRLSNGQIRYSTGMFDSASGCKSRKIQAYESGISDAYIVAYYQGVRIRISEANKLLSENGSSILQSNIAETEPVILVETPVNVVRTDTVTADVVEAPVTVDVEQELKVQVVTKKTFTSFPRDILNRYNTEGNFYYDALDGKVKSVIYDHPDMLPRLYKFEEDIDTVFLSMEQIAIEGEKKSIRVQISSEKVPGDLVDLLLRLPYRREFVKSSGVLMLEIAGIEPNALPGVLNDIRSVGLDPLVVENIMNEN